MDTALTAGIAGTKTLNLLSTPATQRPTNLTALTPTWPTYRPNIFNLYASNSFLYPQTTPNPNVKGRNNIGLSLLTHCSTKPNIDRDNPTDRSSTNEPDSNSEFPNPANPNSNQALSSSSSSSSSCLSSSFYRGLVFDLGPKNSWDSVEIGSPVVKRYLGDEDERWLMWYHGNSDGNSGSDSIGLAVSGNGIHWERGSGAAQTSGDVGLVMSCGGDWWAFDTQSIRPSEVTIMSSSKVKSNNAAVYWLYYTGYSSESVEILDNSVEFDLQNPERVRIGDVDGGQNGGNFRVFKSLPGLAMSQDGRHWARIEGEHHSGALLDVGSDGEWDSLFIASPQVVFHASGDLRMYYHSFDAENGHFAVGIARSRDGMRWVKLGKIIGGGANGGFDECGAMNPCVVRNRRDGEYVMVYEGVGGDGARSVGMAVSSDGLKNWRRVQGGAVLMPSEGGGWDSIGVGSPCLVQMDGNEDEWRLYYRGIGEGGRTGIGMAVLEGSETSRFRRWTGFHL